VRFLSHYNDTRSYVTQYTKSGTEGEQFIGEGSSVPAVHIRRARHLGKSISNRCTLPMRSSRERKIRRRKVVRRRTNCRARIRSRGRVCHCSPRFPLGSNAWTSRQKLVRWTISFTLSGRHVNAAHTSDWLTGSRIVCTTFSTTSLWFPSGLSSRKRINRQAWSLKSQRTSITRSSYWVFDFFIL
jgi:hypothetical protein